MPFTVTLERQPRHVRYTVEGIASLKNYFDLVEQAQRETAADRLVEVDLSRVTGRLHVNEQAFIGNLVAEKLVHLARLATIVADDPASYHSEYIAAAKGFELRTFATRAEAERWLLGA